MSQPDPLARYREILAGLRSDIQVSRHIYQGEPAYLAHDPISFQTHRFSLRDYKVLAALSVDRTLSDSFAELVKEGHLNAEDEHDFYQFIIKLHRLSLLALPIHNGKELFARHETITKARVKSKALGFLFLQIPLTNPDQFLSRTAPLVHFLFTPAFFVVWVLAGLGAIGVIVANSAEFAAPLNGILAAQNLPFLWLALVTLKVWHEFGHGYACKIFGGRVPEMGTILIMGTPAAYVDASAAWSFEKKRHRLTVMLGGMFFESIVAIPAVFLWAMSPNSFVGSCAYQVVFMAGVVTVLFNANPLMRYDGYFILSELLGIQNLRPKADVEVKGWLKRIFLGIRSPNISSNPRLRLILTSYGVAAVAYRQTIILAIAISIASKFLLVGVLLAAYHIAMTIGGAAMKLWQYLLRSTETQPVRRRAQVCAVAAFAGVPLAILILPTPFSISSTGVVGSESEHVVRTETPGVLSDVLAKPGDMVAAKQPLARLTNDAVSSNLLVTNASLKHALTEFRVERNRDFVQSTKLQKTIRRFEDAHEESERKTANLTPTAPASGRVVDVVSTSELGRFVQVGEAIATVVDGETVIRTWLDEEQLRCIRSNVGSYVACRFPGQSIRELAGELQSVQPMTTDLLEELAVTQIAGGEVLVDPATRRPIVPLFEVRVKLSEGAPKWLRHRSRASLKFTKKYESLGAWMYRRCVAFVQKIMLS